MDMEERFVEYIRTPKVKEIYLGRVTFIIKEGTVEKNEYIARGICGAMLCVQERWIVCMWELQACILLFKRVSETRLASTQTTMRTTQASENSMAKVSSNGRVHWHGDGLHANKATHKCITNTNH
jgi:hypothetical protein